MDLIRYIGKRLLMLIPVLFGITLIAFCLGHLSPGDPAEDALARIGVEVPTQEQIEEMREEMGLNDSIAVQYGRWLGNVLHGDLGSSYFSNYDIAEELLMRMPITLKVSLFALVMTVVFGIGFGVLMVLFRHSWVERALQLLTVFLLSVPGFWLAIFLIILFAETLHWLPTSGNGGIRYMLMPAFVLSSATIGTTARTMRASLLRELGEQYVVTARSKGLTERMVTIRHVFRNAVLPVVTLLGNYFGGILGGSSIVESIFSLRGMGSYVLSAINSRDYYIVQGYVLVTGCIFVTVTIAIDIFYILLNPKIRLKGANG